jgi:hypothetical protein
MIFNEKTKIMTSQSEKTTSSGEEMPVKTK